MQIRCRTCDAVIPVENANLDRMLAKCALCNTIFAFTLVGEEGAVPAPPEPVVLPKAEVCLPPGMRAERTLEELRLEQPWYKPSHLVLIPFCLFWNAFLVMWYSAALFMPGPVGSMKLVMLLFPVLHVAVGLGLLYTCLTGLFNRTVVIVRNGLLCVRFAPIPYPGRSSVPVADLDQLFCSERTVVRKGQGQVPVYDLVAQLRNGQTLKLLGDLESATCARFIEQEVEDYLGIEDRPMPGEFVETSPPGRRASLVRPCG